MEETPEIFKSSDDNIKSDLEQTQTPESEMEQLLNILKVGTKEISKKQKVLPLTDNGRVDMTAYKDIYSDIEADCQWIKGKEQEYQQNNKTTKQQQINGQLAELITPRVFYKLLHEKYYVVRSSRYDDIKNHVDTLIIDKSSGEIVCSMDESTAFDKTIVQNKNQNIYKQNLRGVELKYAFKIEKVKNIPHLVLGKAEQTPFFYLPVDINEIYNSREEIQKNDLSKISNYDIKAFNAWMQLMERQLNNLREFYKNNPTTTDISELIKKADNFIKDVTKEHSRILQKESTLTTTAKT